MVFSEISANAQLRQLNPYEQAQFVTLHDASFNERKIQQFIDEKYSLKCSLPSIH